MHDVVCDVALLTLVADICVCCYAIVRSTSSYDQVIMGMMHAASRETALWLDSTTASHADWYSTNPSQYTHAVYSDGQLKHYANTYDQSYLCQSYASGK